MRIAQAKRKTYLQRNGFYFYVDHIGRLCNEMGSQNIPVPIVDYRADDYEPFTPPNITEQGEYTAEVFGDAPVGSTMSMYLVLSEVGGEFHGFRHRFRVHNYRVSIPIAFESTDPRVGITTQAWHVRSGQFFTHVKKTPQAYWKFRTGSPPKLRIDNGTNWIDVPAQ